jgi:hypothetical protein
MTPDDEYADRLREVLRAEAESIVPAADGLSRIRERTARRGAVMRWTRPLAVVGGAAVVAASVAVGFALTGNDDTTLHQNPPPAASPSQPLPTATPSPQVLPAAAMTLPVGLPLWPFADGATAARNASTATGSPPSVALHFTRDHLGFTDNDIATGTTYSPDRQQAWVSVGYHTEGSRTATAAVVHLARWSNNGPWEVVGTRDSTLTLTQPSYGATASSPVTAAGQITGVDESIRVAVHQTSSNQPLGTACCVAGGGSKTPWSEKVSFQSSSASVLTIVASTGGHITQHERWALTAVRTTSNSPNTAPAPSTFVAVSQQRIGVFRTTDGSRMRWLTSVKPGGGASNPQLVGSTIYFLRGLGTCANAVMSVPLTGGTERSVYQPASGNTVEGYAVNSIGQLALTITRCSDNAQQLMVRDPSSGSAHASPFESRPPQIDGDPAWMPDNTHIAIAFRSGTQVSVDVIPAFTFSTSSGFGYTHNASQPCGGAAGQGQAVALAYQDADLLVGFRGPDMVASCSTGTASTVFSSKVAWDGLAVTSQGAVITGGTDSATHHHVLVWAGGHLHDMVLSGVSQPTW